MRPKEMIRQAQGKAVSLEHNVAIAKKDRGATTPRGPRENHGCSTPRAPGCGSAAAGGRQRRAVASGSPRCREPGLRPGSWRRRLLRWGAAGQTLLQALAALQAAGFEAKGLADHAEHDMWFFGGDGPSGTLGRCVLHVVREGNAFVKHSLDFVCYVSHPKHRDAFDAYAAVKLEGARLALDGEEGQKLSEYKRRKHAVCMEVMTKANAWGAAGGGAHQKPVAR